MLSWSGFWLQLPFVWRGLSALRTGRWPCPGTSPRQERPQQPVLQSHVTATRWREETGPRPRRRLPLPRQGEDHVGFSAFPSCPFVRLHHFPSRCLPAAVTGFAFQHVRSRKAGLARARPARVGGDGPGRPGPAPAQAHGERWPPGLSPVLFKRPPAPGKVLLSPGGPTALLCVLCRTIYAIYAGTTRKEKGGGSFRPRELEHYNLGMGLQERRRFS